MGVYQCLKNSRRMSKSWTTASDVRVTGPQNGKVYHWNPLEISWTIWRLEHPKGPDCPAIKKHLKSRVWISVFRKVWIRLIRWYTYTYRYIYIDTHTIHVWYIFTYTWLIFMVNELVNIPYMDGMGYSMIYQVICRLGFLRDASVLPNLPERSVRRWHCHMVPCSRLEWSSLQGRFGDGRNPENTYLTLFDKSLQLKKNLRSRMWLCKLNCRRCIALATEWFLRKSLTSDANKEVLPMLQKVLNRLQPHTANEDATWVVMNFTFHDLLDKTLAVVAKVRS